MSDFQNISEDFSRDLKRIIIFEKRKIPFELVHRHHYYEDEMESASIFSFEVKTGDVERKIKTVFSDGQSYYSVQVSASLYNLSFERENLFSLLNKKNAFSVLLVSNTEKMILGDDRFPMSITVRDNIKDDNSGKDSLILDIYGDTILAPRPFVIV